MIFNAVQFCILFAAVFITSYLLTALVDFERDGRGVVLTKFFAAVLFPFYKNRKYNCSSVILQSSNYIFAVMYILGSVFGGKIDYFVQAIITAVYIIITIAVTAFVQHGLVSKFNKLKGDIK